MPKNESGRPKLRVPWLAVIATVVIQQIVAFVWYAVLFGEAWVAAQNFPFDYRAAHEGVVLAPLVMVIGNAAGAILLAFILQLAYCPFNKQPFERGIAWGFLLWLCVALPIEATRDLFAMRDPMVLLIDGSQSLVSWLIAGGVIGWAVQRRWTRAAKRDGRMNAARGVVR